ncbi:hypothetical protein O3G_MSEX003781 [Manduca sexta]|uniref:KAT8 regulatory NSL complex subunit 2 n=1 Tax=Manduca sexta TaxID=7130 RepID=A0A922CGZ9_MANSE|nr:hypothetical protein O3G_MSEX003781 [Manduca sexta]
MYCFGNENVYKLNAHNIRISELKSDAAMSETPRKVIHLPKVRMLSRGGRLSTGLRITNVKSIRPPDPEMLKKQEEDKLRAQLQEEIMSRSRACAFKGHECSLPVLSGRQYCYRHILKDSTAPYRQCTHTFPNGERCTLPAPAESTDPRDPGLCFEHASAAMLARQRQAAPPRPVITTETLLNQLTHYVKTERPRTTSCASSVSVVSDPSDQEQTSPAALEPFKQIEAPAVNSAYSASILEWCSGSDSDADSVTLGPGGTCRATHDLLSDTEDAPAEDQPLWRAGVYTAEEAVSEAKNTLIMLRSAYVNQMGRLKMLLQTARAQYIKSLKAEKEQYCSINTQARSGPLTVRERRQLRKLKAYASYHKKHGVDAVLSRKLQHKRARVSAGAGAGAVPACARCVFAEGGVRCAARALPAAKHCLRHVLHDRHQVLFTCCGDNRGVSSCRETVAKTPLPSSRCRYHTDPPLYTVFTLKKDESDSDSDSHTSSEASHTDAGESVDDKSDVMTDVNEPVPVQ